MTFAELAKSRNKIYRISIEGSTIYAVQRKVVFLYVPP